MIKWFAYIIFWAGLISACEPAMAQSVLVYQDDFESTVSGWSVNDTDFDPDVTTFLGRFDNSPTSTSRTFTIPASSERVEIVFDFYRFDSWDNTARWGFDRFQIDIDGIQIFSLPFSTIPQGSRSGISGNVDWEHTPLTGKVELAFGSGTYWFDQLHLFKITVDNPGAILNLTLRCALNQGGNDESCGFDNMTVTAFPILPNLSAEKTVETVNGDYALPGNLVEYTIKLENDGGAVDADTIILVDPIPSDVTLFTGDLDGLGNSVQFIDNSVPPSGLTCCSAANIEYSDSTTSPPTFGYIPMSNFDPSINYLRITPSGAMRDAQTNLVDLEFKFRSQIE